MECLGRDAVGVDVPDVWELLREAVEPLDLAEVVGLGAPLDEADVPEDRDTELLNDLPERDVRRGADFGAVGAGPEAVVVDVEGGQAELLDAAIQVPDLRLLLELALVDAEAGPELVRVPLHDLAEPLVDQAVQVAAL